MASHRTYALFAPLLLFTHGILGWVDSIDGERGGPLQVAEQVALVLSVLGFGALVVTLVRWVSADPSAGARHARTESLRRLFGDGPSAATPLGLVALGTLLMALPLELFPLGALLVLIGLGPLTRPPEAELERQPAGTRSDAPTDTRREHLSPAGR